MAYKNNFAFIMVVSILGNIILNMLIKGYLISIGSSFNHKLPIFGSFCRPLDVDCKGMNMIGYGTPSGHSQIIAFLAAFYYFYYKDTEHFSKGKFIALLVLALFTMTTRYTSKMHSIPQILLGASIGVSIAYVLNLILSIF